MQRKNVFIIDIDKFGDPEITGMTDLIVRNKQERGYQVTQTTCRLDDMQNTVKFLKAIPNETTQLVIAAHSRYFKRDGRSLAPLNETSNGKNDVRHIGHYRLDQMISLLAAILEKKTKINEIKFYCCESAVNLNTYGPLFNKINSKGEKKIRIKKFEIGEKTFSHYQNQTSIDITKLSNLEIIMLGIYKTLQGVKRSLYLQGINGMGFMDESSSRKMKSFDQKYLEYSTAENFEEKFVATKKTVDKIGYHFTVSPKRV